MKDIHRKDIERIIVKNFPFFNPSILLEKSEHKDKSLYIRFELLEKLLEPQGNVGFMSKWKASALRQVLIVKDLQSCEIDSLVNERMLYLNKRVLEFLRHYKKDLVLRENEYLRNFSINFLVLYQSIYSDMKTTQRARV